MHGVYRKYIMENAKQDSVPDEESSMVREYHCSKTWCFPFLFVVLCLAAMFIPYSIAVSRGHVDPFLPLVSEVGGIPPQSGIFALLMFSASVIGMPMVLLRHSYVTALNSSNSRKIAWINHIAAVVGLGALLGMIGTASCPINIMHYKEDWKMTAFIPHAIASFSMLFSTVLYFVLQTFLTFYFIRFQKFIFAIRFSALSLLLITFVPLVYNMKAFLNMSRPRYLGQDPFDNTTVTEKVDPNVNVATVSEWIILLLILLFFSTYIKENKMLTMNVSFRSRSNLQSTASVYPLSIQST